MSQEKNSEIIESESMKSKLEQLTMNLLFPSETDAPIEVVTLAEDENIKSVISRETKTEESSITEIIYDDFFAMYGTEKDWQNLLQKEFAKKFGEALNLLRSQSEDVKIFRAGDVRAALYVIGQISPTKWIGLKTTIVET